MRGVNLHFHGSAQFSQCSDFLGRDVARGSTKYSATFEEHFGVGGPTIFLGTANDDLMLFWVIVDPSCPVTL